MYIFHYCSVITLKKPLSMATLAVSELHRLINGNIITQAVQKIQLSN